MKNIKKHLSILLAFLMIFGIVGQSFAASNVDKEVSETAEFMLKMVPEPQFGTLAGEWTVLSLARSGESVPDGYFKDYYKKIEEYVKEKKGDLHRAKFTEYSRIIVALSSIGKDPRNVAGYDLVKPLSNIVDVKKQGLNGPIWGLIAIDTKGYELSDIKNPKAQNSRDVMIEDILDSEAKVGGWNLFRDKDGKTDPDITAMALYALAHYKNRDGVKDAIDRGIQALSDIQLPSGGYETYNDENSESSAQVIIALTTLGIDPMNDYRFVKTDASGKKNSVVDALLTYKAPSGGYKHIHSETEANGMATDQAMEALIAVKRFQEGKPALFDMKDVNIKTNMDSNIESFSDISGNWAQDLIKLTNGYGIANNSSKFEPTKPITRAEFAVGLVNGLKLEDKSSGIKFSDINNNEWYYKQVVIAASNDIVKGVGDGSYNPNATITREEAFTMLARTLKSDNNDLKVLDKYLDSSNISDWAKDSVALLLNKDIIKGRPEGLAPKAEISRAEAVQLINKLTEAKH